jgi:hypothetical protein
MVIEDMAVLLNEVITYPSSQGHNRQTWIRRALGRHDAAIANK